ncbi:hypothetical protein BCR39DRAFT_508065 [Naematelia encephala]|uniref:Uncharacterized protein n=1 Tax=Naematelia encephala TaxID=71784 RepID=A0A1Y2AL03_9TREE|nr:hypothetical protein BCR39DRAFT_508065 [Naematelia encephala]
MDTDSQGVELTFPSPFDIRPSMNNDSIIHVPPQIGPGPSVMDQQVPATSVVSASDTVLSRMQNRALSIETLLASTASLFQRPDHVPFQKKHETARSICISDTDCVFKQITYAFIGKKARTSISKETTIGILKTLGIPTRERLVTAYRDDKEVIYAYLRILRRLFCREPTQNP